MKDDSTPRTARSLSSSLAVAWIVVLLFCLICVWVLVDWQFSQAGREVHERWNTRHENADFGNVKILRVTNFDLEPDEVTVLEPSAGEQVYRIEMLPTKAQQIVQSWVKRSLPKGIKVNGPDRIDTWEIRGQLVKARWSGGYGDFAVLELVGGKRIHVHRTDLGREDQARFNRWVSN